MKLKFAGISVSLMNATSKVVRLDLVAFQKAVSALTSIGRVRRKTIFETQLNIRCD